MSEPATAVADAAEPTGPATAVAAEPTGPVIENGRLTEKWTDWALARAEEWRIPPHGITFDVYSIDDDKYWDAVSAMWEKKNGAKPDYAKQQEAQTRDALKKMLTPVYEQTVFGTNMYGYELAQERCTVGTVEDYYFRHGMWEVMAVLEEAQGKPLADRAVAAGAGCMLSMFNSYPYEYGRPLRRTWHDEQWAGKSTLAPRELAAARALCGSAGKKSVDLADKADRIVKMFIALGMPPPDALLVLLSVGLAKFEPFFDPIDRGQFAEAGANDLVLDDILDALSGKRSFEDVPTEQVRRILARARAFLLPPTF
jgi:hypothetical protein